MTPSTFAHRCASPLRAGPMGLLVILLPLLAADPAFAGDASFDCSSARSKAERIICSSSALSTLDRRISSAYRGAAGALDAPGKSALRVDQHLFLESRDIQAQTNDYDMKADFEWRAGLLENIDRSVRTGFVGVWANAYGEIRIVSTSKGDAFTVDISTVQPYPSFPVCQLKGVSLMRGEAMVVGDATADERAANEGWTVQLTRNGTVLSAEAVRPRTAELSSPPFCDFRSSLDGDYLPVSGKLPDDPRFKGE